MVVNAEVAERLNLRLVAIHPYLDDLPGLEADWNGLDDDAQVSECLRWDHYMADYLTELDEHYRAGDMTPVQQQRYRDLLRRLQEAMPLLIRFQFMLPPV